MKAIYITFAALFTAALAAPPVSLPQGTNLLQKRVCTPPGNCTPAGSPHGSCDYCCANGIPPIVAGVVPYVNETNRCHLHIGEPVEDCNDGTGIIWHCDDEHDDDHDHDDE
ncbi:hypothetical protein TWF730_008967 [Orbilia blumenaviensis]|uniref:Uncharacterized protein n=1 Tax=Orbilia blumenaviensis TaxID=1796055 RepID=A0AAV9UX07_9PEZI